VDLGLPSGLRRVDLDLGRGDAGRGVDVQADAFLARQRRAAVALRRPSGGGVLVHGEEGLVGVLVVVAERVEVLGRRALDGDDPGARRRLDRALARAALRPLSGLDDQDGGDGACGEERGDDREDGEAAAHPQRQAALGALGERGDHRGGLARRPARAGGLGGERILEVDLERARVGVAVLEVLVGHAVEDRREPRGDLRPAHLHVGQVLAHVLHRHRDLVLAVEGDVAGEHLEQHDAEGVDVGLAVDVVAQRLLGRHVVRGAEHAPVGGQPLLVERAGDAEVGDLGRALLVDQDVLRLDVAVDDVARVREAERSRDLDRVGDRLPDRQFAEAADAVLERLALDVLEDDERAPVLLAGVDHAHDVGVRELGHRARLAAEALELVGVGGDLAVHELDRHAPLEDAVERPIDGRHPAGAYLGVEPVPAVELDADERAHAVSVLLWPMWGGSPAPISLIRTARGHGRPSRTSVVCTSSSAPRWRSPS
jgi:hypothetical protein